MVISIPRLVIAAPMSGSGKTTVTLAILSALKKRGLRVAPFKVGPDYIDPQFHRTICQRPAYNLDSWLTGQKGVLNSFRRGIQDADIAVIEGVMGLFDGIGGTTQASTAEVARILGLPVVIVLPARSLSTTAAALIKGLLAYDPDLHFLGVILNGVGSTKHERLLRKALSGLEIPILGAIPRDETFELPSRHLGLVQAEELDLEEKLDLWAERIARYLDLEDLIERARPFTLRLPLLPGRALEPRGKKIAVARDEAFSFYYRENLDLLEEAGAELLYFSPLRDPFPEGAQGLYLGGGYPELFARELSRRDDLRSTLKKLIREGLPVLAECGGFMFLLEGIEVKGETYPMVGAISGIARMTPGLRALGYRQVRFLSETFLFPAGSLALGHEFRYSSISKGHLLGLEVKDAEGLRISTFGRAEKNLLASYIHFHFGSTPEAIQNFLA